MKIKAALFDFDGVLVDTERLYDIFWADMGKRHHIPDPNFSKAIKGSTLEGIINKYFADRSEEEKRQIMDESDSYDVNMDFPPMPGSLEFVRMLKQHQVPVALVTSSGDAKLSQAFKQLPIKDLTGLPVANLTHSATFWLQKIWDMTLRIVWSLKILLRGLLQETMQE